MINKAYLLTEKTLQANGLGVSMSNTNNTNNYP